MTTGFLSRIDPKPSLPPPSGPRVLPSDRYAAAALDEEIRNVETAPEGRRNDTLNTAAFNLRGFINAGVLDEHTVVDELTAAARAAGLDESEIRATINSGFNGADAKVGVRTVPERPLTPVIANPPTDQLSVAEGGIWGDLPPVDGAQWMFDEDDSDVAIWGSGDQILWAEGEALMIAGGMGLGKTTLAGRLVRGRLGLETAVLDLPIAPSSQPVLYLAMDRPRQIRRSFRRQFTEDEREMVKGKLFIKPGPPIADLAVAPSLLVKMAEDVGAGTIFVDSLKDAVVGLSEDATAAAYNRARQAVLAKGVQVCELHHTRKINTANGPLGGVNEVFGSTWLTSGAGSVIILTGEPGDLVIRFQHAKQPAEEVGPWRLIYDPDAGEFTVRRCDLAVLARGAGLNGVTAEEAAMTLYETKRPTASQKKKAERQLNQLVNKGVLTRMDGMHGPVWFLRAHEES